MVNVRDKYGQTLLHWATHNPQITKLLLDKMNSEDILRQAEGNNNYTALHIAVYYKNSEVAV